MTTQRDPLGKRALFSGEPSAPERRKRGPFDVAVHCSSCDTRTTLSAPELIVRHLPVWVPWRKHPHLMRCPACGRVAWHVVSRVWSS